MEKVVTLLLVPGPDFGEPCLKFTDLATSTELWSVLQRLFNHTQWLLLGTDIFQSRGLLFVKLDMSSARLVYIAMAIVNTEFERFLGHFCFFMPPPASL